MSSWQIPYRTAFGGDTARPYLWLNLTGINEKSGDILGIVDSGADGTALPMDYAALMGYGTHDLKLEDVEGVGGATSAFHAKRPCSAHVVGLEEIAFELKPSFAETPMVLWGRADFFGAFGVSFDETGQTFTLSPV